MKAKTQAFGLTQMMKKQDNYSYYDLTLELIKIKKSEIKSLTVEDIIMLGYNNPELLLMSKDKVEAKVAINSQGIIIIDNDVATNNWVHTKKYETLKSTITRLPIRSIDKGMSIPLEAISFDNMTLLVKQKVIAKGTLVSINDELGIKIMEIIN